MGGTASRSPSLSQGGRGWLRVRVVDRGGLFLRRVIPLAVMILMVSLPAVAMTPAGTVISNTASVTYDSGSSVTSNTATIVVAQLAAVQLSPVSASRTGFAGDTVYFPVVVTNAGNGPDSFCLVPTCTAGWPVVIYRDDNGDGLRQATETTVVTSSRALALGEGEPYLLGVTLPSGAAASSAVTITVTSGYDAACTAAASYTAQSLLVCAADFSASPTSGSVPLAVASTDLSTGSPTSWNWDFGDGQKSTVRNPSHVYQSPGTYTVTLTVANSGGQNTMTKSGYITATTSSLTADFSAAPKRGSPPLSVTFKDQSNGQPASWRWNFGDGSQSTERNPVHVYRNPGNFDVTLQVSNGGAAGQKTVRRCVSTTVVIHMHKPKLADLSHDYWAYNEIRSCLEAGVLNAFPDETFRPSLPVTRDQITVYVSRALAGGDDQVPEGPGQPSFRDVPTSYWAYRYVEYAERRKLTTGYADGTFRPTNSVNRGEMAVIIARSVVDPTGEEGLSGYTAPSVPTFADVGPDNAWSWCSKHVEYLASQDIVHGYSDKRYHPEAACTRDQLAVCVAKAFGF